MSDYWDNQLKFLPQSLSDALVFTLDRFFTIFMPFYYSRNGNKIAIAMSIGAWVIGLVCAITKVMLGCIVYSDTYKTCGSVGSCSKTCTIFNSVVTALLFVFCVLVPFISYLVMYVRAKQIESKVVIAEENNKWKLSKETIRTFTILFIVLLGLSMSSIFFYIWFTVTLFVAL